MRTFARWLALTTCASLSTTTAIAFSFKGDSIADVKTSNSSGSSESPNGPRRWDGALAIWESMSANESHMIWFSPEAFSDGRGGPGSGQGSNSSDLIPIMAADPCKGGPLIVTRSAQTNNNCLPSLNEVNASCTCIIRSSKANDNEIVFRLRAKSTEEASLPIPTTVRATEALSISSIASLAVPPSTRSLSYIGVVSENDKKPLSIRLGAGGLPAFSSLIMRWGPSNLTSVMLANLDIRTVITSDRFLPDTVSNLTLSNCNVPNFNIRLIKELSNLEILDLSGNGLAEPYERPQIDRCVTGICPLKSLNLANNQFTTLPTSASFYTTLQHLDLRGNPITNVTVSSEVFDAISSLQSFYVTASSEPVDCGSATNKSVHNVEFCVVGGLSQTVPTVSTTSDSTSNTNRILTYGLIGGCAVVAVLFFIIIRQRKGRHGVAKDNSYHPFASANLTAEDSAFDEAFYNTGTASLLNDPIIITRRIEQSDIRVANCISKGGFGVVYSGVYRRRRRVAIKKIRPEYSTDTKMIETFLREICLMATLRHVRIVEFIGVAWESPRDICAVTEYMDKGDVRELLKVQRDKGKTLVSWENSRKTTVALHVAEALQYLHSLEPKVIHRDLKAKNVLLNSKLEAKLSDFGISRERHVEETHMTAAVGTSFWIAPEVLQGRQDYDERADIYSFGVLLCEIDTEDYPFWTENHPDRGVKAKERAILRGVASGYLRPRFSDSCPPAILALAERCLDADPQNRPTAIELVEALGSQLQSE